MSLLSKIFHCFDAEQKFGQFWHWWVINSIIFSLLESLKCLFSSLRSKSIFLAVISQKYALSSMQKIFSEELKSSAFRETYYLLRKNTGLHKKILIQVSFLEFLRYRFSFQRKNTILWKFWTFTACNRIMQENHLKWACTVHIDHRSVLFLLCYNNFNLYTQYIQMIKCFMHQQKAWQLSAYTLLNHLREHIPQSIYLRDKAKKKQHLTGTIHSLFM